MGYFTKENQPKNRKPRGKGKKTLLKESFTKLELSGINVYATYKTLIDELIIKEDKTEADYTNLITILNKLQDFNDIKSVDKAEISIKQEVLFQQEEILDVEIEADIDTKVINISTKEILDQFKGEKYND